MTVKDDLQFINSAADFGLGAPDYAAAFQRVYAALDRIPKLEELIRDSAQHDSWRCTEYQKCHCGLDEATDELGIPRIPYPPKIRA